MPSRFRFLAICLGETPATKSRKIRSTIAASVGSISRSPVVTDPSVIVFITIAVAQATSGLAVLDSAAQSTVCFLGQVLQVKGIHRALESDVQVGDVAFGDRDDVDAGECQSFEQAGGVFLIAAEAVQGLGEDDVDGPLR